MVGMRQFNEEETIELALDLFWRQGLAATSMPDLAEVTGVQRGSLYNAYGSKNALFLRAFDIYAARFLEAARAALDRADTEEALSTFFALAIANMTSGIPSRGCLATKTAMEIGGHGQKIRNRVRKLLDDLEASIQTALSPPERAKGLSLAPAQAAQVIVTFTRGLAVMERVYRDPLRLKQSAEALIQMLVSQRPK
jgi:TetR/AcrR family transcriptional repressor of nem operon